MYNKVSADAFEPVSFLIAHNVLTPPASAVSQPSFWQAANQLGFEMAATEPVKCSIKYVAR
jgi:hypothetical protein